LAISSSARKYRASTTTLLPHLEALTGKKEAGNRFPRERGAGHNGAIRLEEDNTVRRESDEAPKQELEAGRDTLGQIIRGESHEIDLSSFFAYTGIFQFQYVNARNP